ncbi:MAG: M28 family peptidase [Acidobacteria bacterium]|nr:M28 family peptidase [Acidobacteriota bacterium]
MRRAALLAASFVVATACLGAQASKPAPSVTAQAAVAFDSAKAWEHLRQMVNIGPRPAGSPQLRQTRAYITRHMAALGLKVEEQPFTADTPVGKVDMVNLIVRLPGRRPERILFTGHYDTKPMKNVVFVGASDGASSAAMLMELVRVFKDRPREYTYEFVWLDGEEAFCMGWDDCGKPGSPDNTYGSRYYVQAAKKANATASIKANILVDMVADKDLRIQRESKSTVWLNDIVWAAAKRVGHGAFFPDISTEIEDDHVPFLEAGIPSIDIIDLDYPQWHTADDTLDHVSAKSLQIVGDVIVAAIPDVEKKLLK